MALPIAAKILGIMAIIGLPTAGIYYVVKNNLFLYEVERKILDDSNIYFAVEDKQTNTVDSETTYSWKIKVDNNNDTSVWKEGGYSWECTISSSNESIVDKTKLESKLPTSSNKTEEWRQNNKSILVYLCSVFKDRQKSNNKTIVASFPWPGNRELDKAFPFKQESDSEGGNS